eukprot:CAMPEP_0197023612 /NCGR_PEP_ID=MMETSP1384-20130603/4281_1 /TAXON_ID=29189 /ORGANISM="Ammonia sp." /LENGTH=341 /DNA_ID=CAMNT_0042451853 /DNA_START=29 /DNA_END=1054 /DNA_ORIENTATION=+
MAAPAQRPPQQQQQQQQQAARQPQQPQQQEPRQQVTINAALDTLCAMFDSVDRDVVHMILIEGCGGNMESAVEALLTMTGGVTEKSGSKSKARAAQPPRSQSQSQSQSQAQAPSNAPQSQSQSQAQAQPQSFLNLPDDFLRPPSYFLSKYENAHDYDFGSAQDRQLIEDELFAKAMFEDSLFSADLQKNPEWVLEEMEAKPNKNKGKNKKKGKGQAQFSWRGQYGAQFQEDDVEHTQIDLEHVDPSDLNARRLSFKQRFNSLGSSAKQKLGNLAHKLQRNKQEQSAQKQHEYRNVLTSLDDETLIDEDDDMNNAIIEDASEDNRGTYQAPIIQPPKPSQQL